MEAATKTKTKTGATAFKALTKKEPSTPQPCANPGKARATNMPKTKPAMICLTNDPCLISVIKKGIVLFMRFVRSNFQHGLSLPIFFSYLENVVIFSTCNETIKHLSST